MEINSILLAFLLTMIAGLSTGVGSLIAFFAKRTNTKFLSAALGFSAGVMIYISFMELMPEALGMLSESFSPLRAAFAIGGRCIEIIYSVGNGDIDQLIDSFLVYIVAAVSGAVV